MVFEARMELQKMLYMHAYLAVISAAAARNGPRGVLPDVGPRCLLVIQILSNLSLN